MGNCCSAENDTHLDADLRRASEPISNSNYKILKQKYEDAGQGHIFNFFNELSEDQKAALLDEAS
jgi:hypothetical protein